MIRVKYNGKQNSPVADLRAARRDAAQRAPQYLRQRAPVHCLRESHSEGLFRRRRGARVSSRALLAIALALHASDGEDAAKRFERRSHAAGRSAGAARRRAVLRRREHDDVEGADAGGDAARRAVDGLRNAQREDAVLRDAKEEWCKQKNTTTKYMSKQNKLCKQKK
jgi:hypothetical protein